MSTPIKAWAIKFPRRQKIDPGTVETSEGGAWRRAVLLYGSIGEQHNDKKLKALFEDGYRAVRVEIREVEE